MSIGAGTAISAAIAVYHMIVDAREQRRWFARWSISMAHRTGVPPDDVEAQARAWRQWAQETVKARAWDGDEAADEHPLIDPDFLRLQHVCWAAELSGGNDVDDAMAYLGMADRAVAELKPQPLPPQPDNPTDFQHPG